MKVTFTCGGEKCVCVFFLTKNQYDFLKRSSEAFERNLSMFKTIEFQVISQEAFCWA